MTLRSICKAAAVGGGLVLTFQVFSPALSSENPPRCDGATARVGDNMPFNTVDDAHTITHVVSVTANERRIGWLYEDRNGSRWVQTSNDRTIPRADYRWFQRTFGEDVAENAPYRGVASQMLHEVDVAGLAQRHTVLHGCG